MQAANGEQVNRACLKEGIGLLAIDIFPRTQQNGGRHRRSHCTWTVMARVRRAERP